MRILRMKFRTVESEWHNGGIHDPCSSDSYHERISLEENGIESHGIADCRYCSDPNYGKTVGYNEVYVK